MNRSSIIEALFVLSILSLAALLFWLLIHVKPV